MLGKSDVADYCRQIETYLCQKNEGHLIRVVGPSFDLVARWATDGVPLKVALRGIDRYMERYYRQGPRRRPVKIDFCEADVLDVFDEWRRATGIALGRREGGAGEAGEAGGDGGDGEGGAARRTPSLPEHLARALVRLSNARAVGTLSAAADPLIDRISSELDAAKVSPRGVRGTVRAALVGRLDNADRELMALARAELPGEGLAAIARDVEEELASFKASMAPDALERARQALIDHAIRERLHLPVLTFA